MIRLPHLSTRLDRIQHFAIDGSIQQTWQAASYAYCLMHYVKSNHVTKVSAFSTLTCMTPEYVFFHSIFSVHLNITIKVLFCTFATLEELKQFLDIILSLLMQKEPSCKPK
jgi:hypothetical protein